MAQDMMAGMYHGWVFAKLNAPFREFPYTQANEIPEKSDEKDNIWKIKG
jgi:hypothetical protein